MFLAPLAGYTNGVFRTVCEKLGAGLTFTEMVSAKGLCYGSEKTEQLLYVSEDYRGIKAAQIFGNDPEYMRRACESDALAKFDLIDINMGCPVPKIYKNGEGSALMNDLPLVGRIVSECKKSGKLVSVKFRTGLDESRKITAEFARVCAGAGADLICIHGRTRDKMYSGAVDFEEIAAAKRAVDIPVIANGEPHMEEIAHAKAAVSIPVIANGGIFCAADADELLEKTGADGVAVARGAMYRPWVFAEITGKEIPDIKDIVRGQLHKTREIYGERFACVFMRKMLSFYLKGQKNSAALRATLMQCADCNRILQILDTVSL